MLAVVAVAGSIIIALLQGTPESGFLELLSFMAISAYRIMPSLSRINGAVMLMRGQEYVLDTMEQGCLHPQPTKNVPPRTLNTPLKGIQLSDITLSYDALEAPVLDHLEHTFGAGKIHGIVGPSGSGKSTIINALLGLHKPKRGSIQIQFADNDSIALNEDIDLHTWVLNVAYLSQQPFLFQGSVEDNLTLRVPGTKVNEERVASLIHRLKLTDCLGASPLTFDLQEGGSNLSGGQQQRLALLRALQIQRPVLILDEATSALDSELRDVVFGLLRERAQEGCNVILVTHDKDLAARCDDVLDLGASPKTPAA